MTVKYDRIHRFALASVAFLSATGAYAATPRHTFTFDTTLQASESASVLTSHGGSIVGGDYVFDLNEGLTLPNALADPAIYSIEMRVQMDDLFSGTYRKLVDFQEQTEDSGLYYRLGNLRFWPVSDTGPYTVQTGEWATVVLTRDAAGNMRSYLNGVEQFSIQTARGVSQSNTLNFLRDDAATNFSEASAGRIDYLRIYDDVLTAAQVAALTAPSAVVVARDLFAPGDELLTYDPNTGNEWLDLSLTIDQSINGINAGEGGWVDLGFRVATQSEIVALWTALGAQDIGTTSVNNVAGVTAFFDTLGCTWSCNLSGFDRANGISLRDGGGVSTVTVDIYYNEDPVTARPYFPGVANGDYTNFTSGIYLVRNATQVDSDNDGVGDALDNCIETFNIDQRDSNADGFGNVCDADLNNDGVVNAVDLGLLRVAFFTDDADADLNGDGVVNIVDLGTMRARFFAAPGPSGLAP